MWFCVCLCVCACAWVCSCTHSALYMIFVWMASLLLDFELSEYRHIVFQYYLVLYWACIPTKMIALLNFANIICMWFYTCISITLVQKSFLWQNSTILFLCFSFSLTRHLKCSRLNTQHSPIMSPNDIGQRLWGIPLETTEGMSPGSTFCPISPFST